MAKKKVHAARKAAGKTSKKKKVSKSARAKAATGSPAKAVAAANLKWVHDLLDKLVATFPEDKATFQTAGTDNHLMWTLGHLAVTYSWLASLVDGKAFTLPESYNALFGYQSKPTGDASTYPPIAEVKKNCAAAFGRLTDAIAKISGADLEKPTASDSFGFAKTRHEAILRAAWHDGCHSGQISSLRRALGLPSVM
jgi:hypothetical protein